jgi:hypothetical protein
MGFFFHVSAFSVALVFEVGMSLMDKATTTKKYLAQRAAAGEFNQRLITG